jgi:hypothetical protein
MMQFSKMILPPIHTAGIVQIQFEENGGELQHLTWPPQSPNLNIIEPLWSVLETRVRNRFPLPTYLKKLEDVLQEKWYEILLEASKLVRVHSKKDCGWIEGKRWSSTILIKKYVQYL